MEKPVTRRCVLFVLLCAVLPLLHAQHVGEAVRIQGVLAEDVYAAGGTVDILANVDGDVVTAGGRVSVSERIGGDVMAAGGAVSINADIGDDLRVAGGDVTIGGTIGDDAIAAGGNVTLMPGGSINGRAWFSGGRIDVAGSIGRELKAGGGRIVISGHVHGDVLLNGSTISILDSAVIDGNLVYQSPREAEIAAGARIAGSISYEPVEQPVGPIVAAVAGAAIVLLLGLIVTGSALFLLFPSFIETALVTIRSEPWQCLGLGLAVFAATPVVISVLFMTLIGWLPALVIGALYLLLLIAGLLAGVFLVGSLGPGLRKQREVSRSRRLWSFVVALLVLTLLGLIPLPGALLLFAIMLLGVGSLVFGMYRAYAA